MNLLGRMAGLAEGQPNALAIVYHRETFTYQQLWDKVTRFASSLTGLGVKENDRVMVMLANCPEFVISYYGIMAAGAVVVPVNPIYTAKEVGTIVADCDPSAVITSMKTAPVVETALQENNLPARNFIITREFPAADKYHSFDALSAKEAVNPLSTDQEDHKVVEFLYTSGTTGIPKGAMLTHHNLYSNAAAFAALTEMSSSDRALLSAPAYHAAAQTCVMNNTLYAGGTLVIHDGWLGPEPVLKSFQDDKITFFFGPPTMYTFLVNFPDVGKYNCQSLRLAFTGAASLPAEIFRKFRDLFGFEIMEGYGLSETSPVVTTNPYRGVKKIGSIGTAIPGVEVKIFDDNDRELPRGQIGEIVVRGPNVMKGYYAREEETAAAMRSGWFHTGDLAYMDEDGYVFIVDRKKDLIIRGGMNIYPREVEEVIYAFPGVLEAAVVGVKDEVMGEEVKAYVVPKPGTELDGEQIKEHCREKMARYKVPRYVEIVDSLPKTTTGKILKRELRDKL